MVESDRWGKWKKIMKVKNILPWLLWLSGLSVGQRTKGHWFDSQSEHMPGLRASRGLTKGNHTLMFPFSLSLPPSLKMSKILKKKKKK